MDGLIQGVLNGWSSDKLKFFTCSTADVNVTHSKSILCVTYVLKGCEKGRSPLTKYPETNVKCEKFSRLSSNLT